MLAPTLPHLSRRSYRPAANPVPGPPRDPEARGFSLLELLLVMLAIGLFVGLAIPRYHEYRQRYDLAAMIAELRKLATAEEAYWNVTGTYSSDPRKIQFKRSPRVSISLVSGDSLGWAAKAGYAGDSAICAIYYGNAPVLSPARIKNVIACTR